MFKHILTLSAGCFIFLAAFGISNSQAQNTEIGYVDPQAILSKMPAMKAVQQRLRNLQDRQREELAQKQQDFNEQLTAYQQKISVISEEAQRKEEERLGQLSTELQQFRVQLQQEMQQKQQELVGPLLQQISDAISTVATDMGLTYVLNTTTSTGDVIILYASDEAQANYDITDRVMQELDI